MTETKKKATTVVTAAIVKVTVGTIRTRDPTAPRPPTPSPEVGEGGRVSNMWSEQFLRRLLSLQGGEETLDIRADIPDSRQEALRAAVGVAIGVVVVVVGY